MQQHSFFLAETSIFPRALSWPTSDGIGTQIIVRRRYEYHSRLSLFLIMYMDLGGLSCQVLACHSQFASTRVPKWRTFYFEPPISTSRALSSAPTWRAQADLRSVIIPCNHPSFFGIEKFTSVLTQVKRGSVKCFIGSQAMEYRHRHTYFSSAHCISRYATMKGGAT